MSALSRRAPAASEIITSVRSLMAPAHETAIDEPTNEGRRPRMRCACSRPYAVGRRARADGGFVYVRVLRKSKHHQRRRAMPAPCKKSQCVCLADNRHRRHDGIPHETLPANSAPSVFSMHVVSIGTRFWHRGPKSARRRRRPALVVCRDIKIISLVVVKSGIAQREGREIAL